MDVLISDGRITAIGSALQAPDAERFNAQGGALLPGLKDHHMHLAALAVARHSVDCSPAGLADAKALSTRLRSAAPVAGWLRGIAYHPVVAGDIDAVWLDRWGPEVPIRIQHQGGRLWVFNSLALERLQVTAQDPLEREQGRLTGRLYEGDLWLRGRMQALGESVLPDLHALSRELAAYGIVGLTDTTPGNNPDSLQWLASAQLRGELLQDVLMMGDASLHGLQGRENVTIGALKFHLLESRLPEMDSVIRAIKDAHAAGRNVAFHCVTRAELGFALAALETATVLPGDRIEHASVTPDEWLAVIRELGVWVVTQPGFIYERGDQYLREVDAQDQRWLYRLKAFLDAGVPLAGSSDAPYSHANPWVAMQAAVQRHSRQGQPLAENEALTPEQALALYLGPLSAPGSQPSGIAVGGVADLCLLSSSWKRARQRLSEVSVQMTLKSGRVLFCK